MKIKIEIELEDADLDTLIKSGIELFRKYDWSKITPKTEVDIHDYDTVNATVTVKDNEDYEVTIGTVDPDSVNETYIYDDGSGNKTVVDDDEKKNEEFQA